jgi:hypothetical protein
MLALRAKVENAGDISRKGAAAHSQGADVAYKEAGPPKR